MDGCSDGSRRAGSPNVEMCQMRKGACAVGNGIFCDSSAGNYSWSFRVDSENRLCYRQIRENVSDVIYQKWDEIRSIYTGKTGVGADDVWSGVRGVHHDILVHGSKAPYLSAIHGMLDPSAQLPTTSGLLRNLA